MYPPISAEVFRQEVRAALLKHSPAALGRVFAVLEGSLDDHLQPVHGPLLAPEICFQVRASIDGRPERALPVAVAATLCFLAFDLLDDLQDGDVRPWWRDYTRSELMLAAAAIPATLPLKVLLEHVSDPGRSQPILETYAEGLIQIADGQARDLATVGTEDVSPEEVEDIVALKAGAQMALYARLTALLGGCPEPDASAFAAAAHGIVCAGQIRSDIADLMDASWSRDLGAGVRTLPLAFALHRCQPSEKPAFMRLLEAARSEREAQFQVRARLQSCGAIAYSLIRSAVHRARASKALQPLDLGREQVAAWHRLIAGSPV